MYIACSDTLPALSLTTPPCTEGVSWYIFSTPILVSEDQVFVGLYPLFTMAFCLKGKAMVMKPPV